MSIYRISIIILIFLTIGCASLQPISDADRTFERIIKIPNYSKEQIFDGTKIWVAENFKSAKAVLEYENKNDGIIIGNGSISYPCNGLDCLAKGDWKVSFTMRVDIKDQRFRLTFSNLYLSWPPSKYSSAYNGPISTQGELDAIKPKLLEFGDQLLISFGKDRIKKDW